MTGQLSGWDDTIVALATAPGMGALGVIRLSGDNAIDIVNKLFGSKDLSGQPSHTLHVGLLKNNGLLLDEVVVSLYKNPKSYTGEDVVEISCHGSAFVLGQVIAACIEKGARMAKPGEFTQRAFLNGKLDLTQAESVADLIASNSEASRETAIKQMRGGFSKDLKLLREELIRFSALIELELDFSQEDVEFADRAQFKKLVDQLTVSTNELLHSFRLGNAIKNGVQVAIIGKPNAGKSTLLNALLNEDRAIVSDIPGTTRDTVEEILNIRGILFRLIDTAGIRQHHTDSIESIGIEKSREKMHKADIILLIEDAVTMLDQPASENGLRQEVFNFQKRVVHVLNKSDLLSPGEVAKLTVESLDDAIMIAAKNSAGLELLKDRLFRFAVSGDIAMENTIVTNARHFAALQKMANSLEDVQQGLANNIPADLLALDIRQCLHYLGEITGQITNEDQLDFIFSKFCIGK